MNKLVRKEDVIAIAEGFVFTDEVQRKQYMCFLEYCLDNAPTVEAKSVVHGEWIFKNDGAYGKRRAYCSICGKRSGIGGIESNQRKPFCPNCGGDMRKEVE